MKLLFFFLLLLFTLQTVNAEETSHSAPNYPKDYMTVLMQQCQCKNFQNAKCLPHSTKCVCKRGFVGNPDVGCRKRAINF
ncbi:hypothetical protein SNEBB_003871 [Seison nebaliae]|nr:hypothetical protein SNEBB_003871 [Seison nebaliae]